MSIIEAIVYGIIQGLSEFLPVSSSGHLALLPYVMKIKDPGVLFDLMMHVGTALAVLIYFKHDVLFLIKGSFSFLKLSNWRDKKINSFSFNFLIATIASVFLILIIKAPAEKFGRSSTLIGVNLMVFGILLFLSDRNKKFKNPTSSELVSVHNYKDSIIIGLSQSLAIFPGVSRSGITITAARFLGYTKEQASSFSFLLSLPIIVAGAAKKCLDAGFKFDNFSIPMMAIGLIVSFIIGILTIHFFMKFIKRVSLGWFTLYRIIIGILVLSLA